MPKFILAFHGTPQINSPKEGQKMMADWQAWNALMGEAIVDIGSPVGKSKTVSDSGVADDGGASPLSGFTFVEAETVEDACELAKGCPLVTNGWGAVEVAECMDMSMDGPS